EEFAVSSSVLEGLLVVDKPLGASSMDVVRRGRGTAGLGRRLKGGHSPTAYPLGTGGGIRWLGPATRLVEQLMGLTKVYQATIDLSAFTTTDDREGERQEVAVAVPPDEATVREILNSFVGSIEQKPPAFSAVHIEGQRAYKLARKG